MAGTELRERDSLTIYKPNQGFPLFTKALQGLRFMPLPDSKDHVRIANEAITILLVEDAEEDVFFFTMALRKCAVATSLKVIRDGEAAWKFLRESENRAQLDVIFLDVKLPLMTGFEVLERLRNEEIFLHCPLMILSGSCEAVDKRKALDLGVTEYLEKPITASTLRKFLPCPAIA